MIAAQNLVKSSRKVFTLKDLIHHCDYKKKNLIEMISEYPNLGVGFRIAKIHWPEDYYVKVFRVDLATNRLGKVFGKVYRNGILESEDLVEMDETSARGLWRYDLGDSICYMGEGFIYTLEDLNKHYQKVEQQPWNRPAMLRRNMDWSPPEGAIEPVVNRNIIKRS